MKTGFTLVELLVVVLIVGVLSAIALPQYTTAIERARAAEALTLMGAVRDSVERYRFQHDVWPTNMSDLDVSVPLRPGSSSQRGGKSFILQMGSHPSDPTGPYWIIEAKRDLTEAQGGYQLQTVLWDNASNETITARRCCGTKTSPMSSDCGELTSGTKAETFCNAITGGNNSDF